MILFLEDVQIFPRYIVTSRTFNEICNQTLVTAQDRQIIPFRQYYFATFKIFFSFESSRLRRISGKKGIANTFHIRCTSKLPETTSTIKSIFIGINKRQAKKKKAKKIIMRDKEIIHMETKQTLEQHEDGDTQ